MQQSKSKVKPIFQIKIADRMSTEGPCIFMQSFDSNASAAIAVNNTLLLRIKNQAAVEKIMHLPDVQVSLCTYGWGLQYGGP